MKKGIKNVYFIEDVFRKESTKLRIYWINLALPFIIFGHIIGKGDYNVRNPIISSQMTQ